MRKFKAYSFKKVYVADSIYEDDSDQFKIGYFNISGFMSSNHAEYLDKDLNLLKLDYLVVSETWLCDDYSNDVVINKLKNWRILKRLDSTDNIKHMGLLLLSPYSANRDKEILFALDYVEGYHSNTRRLLYQGLVMNIKNYYKRSVFLYIRESPNNDETEEIAKRFQSFDCIIGDLNLNPQIYQQKKKLLYICGRSKHMLLEEITTTNNTQLDHVIIENNLKQNSFATAYHNYASYHKSIVLRITSSQNNFTSWFKQKISFNADSHLRRSNKKTNQIERTKETMLKILLFSNEPGNNLCFSNAVISMLLNIPIMNDIVSSEIEPGKLNTKHNEITKELIKLFKEPQFSFQSTERIRTIIKLKCFKNGQLSRKFNDKKQHDAGEFMTSMFEHLFKETLLPMDSHEKIFGGLMQEKIMCKCGTVKSLPIENIPEIWTISIHGSTIQSCIDHYLIKDRIFFSCEACSNPRTEKEINLIVEPHTLIIQLKRYEFDSINKKSVKKHDSVICPTDVNLPGGSRYKLSSILNHEGSSPLNGHYTLSIFDQENKSFVLLDDAKIQYDLLMEEEITKLSYIVTYVKE